jgi:hypothetical protein
MTPVIPTRYSYIHIAKEKKTKKKKKKKAQPTKERLIHILVYYHIDIYINNVFSKTNTTRFRSWNIRVSHSFSCQGSFILRVSALDYIPMCICVCRYIVVYSSDSSVSVVCRLSLTLLTPPFSFPPSPSPSPSLSLSPSPSLS